jgi:hypothetical protein
MKVLAEGVVFGSFISPAVAAAEPAWWFIFVLPIYGIPSDASLKLIYRIRSGSLSESIFPRKGYLLSIIHLKADYLFKMVGELNDGVKGLT